MSLWKLDTNNATPLTRTPWAGTHINSWLHKEKHSPIGELWAASCLEPFLSQIQNNTIKLKNIESFPQNFLFKLISTKESLSIQVHPQKEMKLKPYTCGKMESWLILEADETSFIYAGFKENLSEEELRAKLFLGDVSCLNKMMPQKGDIIGIPAGCVHCLGPNLWVAEPQIGLSKGDMLTFRIFDWNKTYDDFGRPSPHGKKRPLHIEESFEAIDWNLPTGEAFLKTYTTSLEKKPFWQKPFLNLPFSYFLWDQEGSFSWEHDAIILILEGKLSHDIGEKGEILFIEKNNPISLLPSSLILGCFLKE